MQAFEYNVGVDVLPGTASFFTRTQPACDEFGLNTTALDIGPDRGFHELGQGFAIGQHSLYLGTKVGLDADGRNGGGLHALRVSQLQRRLFATRIDVDEELTRLRAHLSELRRILSKGGAVGKRLDFLMQELNREANTLGSKSVDVEVSQTSMELKVLIEQMREQVQNIE